MKFEDIRVARRWAWIYENDPQVRIQFILGEENKVANLLSRPINGINCC